MSITVLCSWLCFLQPQHLLNHSFRSVGTVCQASCHRRTVHAGNQPALNVLRAFLDPIYSCQLFSAYMHRVCRLRGMQSRVRIGVAARMGVAA